MAMSLPHHMLMYLYLQLRYPQLRIRGMLCCLFHQSRILCMADSRQRKVLSALTANSQFLAVVFLHMQAIDTQNHQKTRCCHLLDWSDNPHHQCCKQLKPMVLWLLHCSLALTKLTL